MPIDPSFLDAAEHLIRRKARKLCRHRAFGVSNVDDIAQELRMHVLQQGAKFDPAITTWEQFVSFILDKRVVSLVRHALAEIRAPDRLEASLNEPVCNSDGEDVERHETTPELARDTDRLRDLQRDVASVLSRLPDDLRAVALALAWGTPHGVGVELGMSRRVVPQLVEQLREIFRDAGLDEYLR